MLPPETPSAGWGSAWSQRTTWRKSPGGGSGDGREEVSTAAPAAGKTGVRRRSAVKLQATWSESKEERRKKEDGFGRAHPSPTQLWVQPKS